MKTTILIDNIPHPTLDLNHEHGLSIYFEADGYKWLMDVGATELFALNADKMGIDIADIDFLVLSHGHSDHTGGLAKFLRLNQKADIYMSSEIEEKLFFSYRHHPKRDISINHFLVRQHINRFVVADHNTMITENVAFIRHIPHQYATPKANDTLYVSTPQGDVRDTFDHEAALAVMRPDGLVVFSGCSHNGVLNMLEACTQYLNQPNVKACIGGTHLLDSDDKNQYETSAQITQIAQTIAQQHPNMQLITGHCTGTNAKRIFADTLKGNFETFYTGFEMEL